jgi:hypothetical protein
MPRASSILCLPAILALVGAASAVELPVIVNGTQVAQATKTEVAPAPAGAKMQLPVIINYPSAALQAAPAGQKTDAKLPVIIATPVKPAPARVAVAYTVPTYVEYMTPVAYNAYGIGSTYSVNGSLGDGMYAPYGGRPTTYSGRGDMARTRRLSRCWTQAFGPTLATWPRCRACGPRCMVR